MSTDQTQSPERQAPFASPHAIEQYKAKMVDLGNLGTRHTMMTTYYVSILTAIFALLALKERSIAEIDTAILTLVCSAGFLVSLLWFFSVRFFRGLFRVKLKVLTEIEETLPYQTFKREFDLMSHSRTRSWLWFERIVPIVFALFFLVVLGIRFWRRVELPPMPPIKPSSSWYFAVSGDSRDCGDLVMPKIAQLIQNNRDQAAIEFYWHLGDFRRIFSIDCDIAKRSDPSFRCDNRPQNEVPPNDYVSKAWDDFIQNQVMPFERIKIPVFLGIGNHELYANLSRDDFRLKFKKWLTQEPLGSQRNADSANGILSSEGDTYYHFIKNGVDFIYLDNAEVQPLEFKAYFSPRQINWLSHVLAADKLNDSIKTIIVGMHAALPYSKSSNHAMDASCQGICSGLQVYDLLYRAQNLGDPVEKQKHVYALASHSHYFEENVFDTPEHRARGQILPGWIIGTAGAEQYRNEIKYGFLQVEVRSDGIVNTQFKEVTRDMPPVASGPGAESLTNFCFEQNRRASITSDAFKGDCPCGAATTPKP